MILDRYMKTKKIKAKTLAQNLGVDASLISKIRKGKAVPSTKLAAKIEKLTGINRLRLLYPNERNAA